MSDFESEFEASAYRDGFKRGMLDTVALACDRVLSVLEWKDRYMVLDYLMSARPPEDNDE